MKHTSILLLAILSFIAASVHAQGTFSGRLSSGGLSAHGSYSNSHNWSAGGSLSRSGHTLGGTYHSNGAVTGKYSYNRGHHSVGASYTHGPHGSNSVRGSYNFNKGSTSFGAHVGHSSFGGNSAGIHFSTRFDDDDMAALHRVVRAGSSIARTHPHVLQVVQPVGRHERKLMHIFKRGAHQSNEALFADDDDHTALQRVHHILEHGAPVYRKYRLALADNDQQMYIMSRRALRVNKPMWFGDQDIEAHILHAHKQYKNARDFYHRNKKAIDQLKGNEVVHELFHQGMDAFKRSAEHMSHCRVAPGEDVDMHKVQHSKKWLKKGRKFLKKAKKVLKELNKASKSFEKENKDNKDSDMLPTFDDDFNMRNQIHAQRGWDLYKNYKARRSM